MRQVTYTEKAYLDLKSIWNYHADIDLELAEKIQANIFKLETRISEFPFSFPERSDLVNKSYRFALVKNYNYFVIYDSGTDPIKILRILSTKRNVRKSFIN